MILIDKYNVENLPELNRHIENTANRHDVRMIYNYVNKLITYEMEYRQFNKSFDLGRCDALIDVLQDQPYYLSTAAIADVISFAYDQVERRFL